VLRWNPPHNAWTCDRCRSVFPPGAIQSAPQVTPSQPYQAAPSGPSPSPWAPQQGQTPAPVAASPQAKTMFHAGAATAAAQPQTQPRTSSPTPAPPVGVQQPRPHSPTPPPPTAPPYGAPQTAPTPQPFGVPPQGSGPHMHAQQPMPQQPMMPPGSPYAPGAPGGAPMPYSPHPPAGAMMPAYAPHGRKSNTGMIIGIVVGVLAVAGIIIGIVVAKSGGAAYGAGSKDDLVKETLAGLAAGDIDKLMKLGGPDNMSETFLDCEKSKGGDSYGGRGEKDDKKERARMKEKFQEAIDSAKGLKLEYVSLDETKEPKKMEKGERAGEDCKFKYDIAIHRAEVKVKVSKGDKTREQKSDIRFIEIDGHWILDRAPKLSFGPDCAGAMQHMIMMSRDDLRRSNATDTQISKLEDKLAAQCTDENWAEEAVQCFADATATRDTMRCTDKLTSSQRDGLYKVMLEALNPSGSGGISPPPPPPPPDVPATPPADPSAIPAACQDYKKALEEAIACDKLPQSSRDSLTKSLDGMMKLWASYPTLPASSQDSIQKTCRDGADQMRKMVRSLCP